MANLRLPVTCPTKCSCRMFCRICPPSGLPWGLVSCDWLQHAGRANERCYAGSPAGASGPYRKLPLGSNGYGLKKQIRKIFGPCKLVKTGRVRGVWACNRCDLTPQTSRLRPSTHDQKKIFWGEVSGQAERTARGSSTTQAPPVTTADHRGAAGPRQAGSLVADQAGESEHRLERE
jgi:hypothetical protein